MTPRSTRRGRGVRAILAGGLLALAAASLPASAASGDAPILEKTSIGTGWSKSASIISWEFDKILAPVTTADVTVTEVLTGNPVAGTVTHIGKGVAFQPASSFVEDGRFYSTSITVGAAEAPTQTTTVAKNFRVDTLIPAPPTVTKPSGTKTPRVGDVQTTIVMGPLSGAFEGAAHDKKGVNDTTLATSGIAYVQLRFYDVIDQAFSFGESDDTFRVKVTQSCGGQCLADVDPWSIDMSDIEDLSSGIWSVRAVAFDLAGNESGPSAPITFVVL